MGSAYEIQLNIFLAKILECPLKKWNPETITKHVQYIV
jgi:hypothetical protein